ncbi:hypothetical protein ACOME3_003105 [Neoechinorhynchus agilis]
MPITELNEKDEFVSEKDEFLNEKEEFVNKGRRAGVLSISSRKAPELLSSLDEFSTLQCRYFNTLFASSCVLILDFSKRFMVGMGRLPLKEISWTFRTVVSITASRRFLSSISRVDFLCQQQTKSTEVAAGPKSNRIVRALAALRPAEPLKPVNIYRRDPDEDDAVIEIDYCGICHFDIHNAKNDYKMTQFPVVPGHEIVGRVIERGSNVSDFAIGDKVAVGTYVDTCRECRMCIAGSEEYCNKPGGLIMTYNSPYKKDKRKCTLGGYSRQIVVDKNYIFHLPENLPPERAAPLPCAGITVYMPLKRYNVRKGSEVAVAGLGGLGHMALKLSVAMGARCTVLSRTDKKKEMATKMGVHEFVVTSDKSKLASYKRRFDVIVDSISMYHDIDELLGLLNVGGSLVLVGLPPEQYKFSARSVVRTRSFITGSTMGSLKDIREMFELCSKHGITCEVEVIRPDQVNEAYERVLKGDVQFRFVMDMSKL